MVNVKDVLRFNGISYGDAVKAIKKECPRFNKFLLSNCAYPEQYGVQLTNKAQGALAQYINNGSCNKSDHHRLKRRVSCRFSEYDYQRLLLVVRNSGFPTMQTFLSALINRYVDRARNEGRISYEKN